MPNIDWKSKYSIVKRKVFAVLSTYNSNFSLFIFIIRIFIVRYIFLIILIFYRMDLDFYDDLVM